MQSHNSWWRNDNKYSDIGDEVYYSLQSISANPLRISIIDGYGQYANELMLVYEGIPVSLEGKHSGIH
jgi:hypothetical protein